jgi:Rgg/GadR/MutR family transcriptional activator
MDKSNQFENFRANLGRFLKQLRKTKKITQEKACKGIFSRRTLSSIENGSSNNIDLRYLFNLSQIFNFPLNEIVVETNDYLMDKLTFLDRIQLYYNDKNLLALQNMLKEKRKEAFANKEQYLHILLLSDYIYYLDSSYPIQKSDVKNAIDYLEKVEVWNYLNVILFGQVAHLLNINLVCSFAKDIIKHHKKAFLVNRLKKHYLINTLINVIYFCLEENYLKYVKFFLDNAYSLIAQPQIIEYIGGKLFLDYEYGYYLLMNGEQKKGQKIMSNVIAIFSLSGHDVLADKFQQIYNEAIIKITKDKNHCC